MRNRIHYVYTMYEIRSNKQQQKKEKVSILNVIANKK